MRILGIDSGMASSGAVLVEGGAITKYHVDPSQIRGAAK